jgi:sugar/nucleoside kinase (ribokinase family)
MTAPPFTFSKVHVLAGAHVDMVATFAAKPIMATSNPATFEFMAGGGGLNIASALAALDVPVRIVAPVGADRNGELLRQTCDNRGIGAELVESVRHPTGIYAGLFTPQGELTVGAADLRQNELIDVDWIDRHFLPAIKPDDLILLTANVPEEVLLHVVDQRNGARLAAAAISATKSRRLIPLLKSLDLLFLNSEEARSITRSSSHDTTELAGLLGAMGLRGAVMTDGANPVRWWQAGEFGCSGVPSPTHLVNVNGAGDCLAGTVLASLSKGENLANAVAYGIVAASLTVQVAETVPPVLNWQILEASSSMQINNDEREY